MLPILVLLWKCYLVRKRRIISTVIELLFPLIPFICFALVVSKLGINSESKMESNSYSTAAEPLRVSYWPSTLLTNRLMNEVSHRLHLGWLDHVPQEDEKGYALLSDKYTMAEYAGKMEVGDAIVIFQLQDMNGTVWPKTLNYTIRMKAGPMPQNIVKLVTQNRVPPRKFDTIFEPFVSLQWAIDTSFLQVVAGTNINPSLTMEAVSHSTTRMFGDGANSKPLRSPNRYAPILCFNIRLCYKVALFLPFITFITRMLEEKNSGIQELMKMMGVSIPTLYVVHFLDALPTAAVFTVGVPALLKLVSPPLLPATSFIMAFLGLTLLFWSIIALAAFLSYVISSKRATVFAVTMYCAILFLFPLVAMKITRYTGTFLPGMFPFEPSDWFWKEVGLFELVGQGASFDKPSKNVTGPTIGICFLYMTLQIIVYAGLGLFLAYVRPGPFGEGRPFTFPCRTSFWLQSPVERLEKGTVPDEKADPRFFERPPSLPVGIEIIDITKVFSKHVALAHLNLVVFKGEITLLLGHNGAGKTTLMNIITGMCAPTSGQVRVNGFDVGSSRHARAQLGLCPQHHLFFPHLTVQEHIVVFAMLKGTSKVNAYASAAHIVQILDLRSKQNSIPSTLSGGMKRRVQLACALAGDSSVLILDEPTSGLDVETRRGLWDLLLSLRGDRTVLLTTHFMEEADALGDRVAALHSGHLKCHATPMFLKNAVGGGYCLSFFTAKEPNEAAITALIQKSVPGASVRNRTHKSIAYNLPSKNSSMFPNMFSKLEKQKESLGITSIAIGKSTLDDVFQRLCSDTVAGLDENLQWAPEPTFQKLTGVRLYMHQYKVLIHRQFRFMMSGIVLYAILHIIIPIAIIIAVVEMTNLEVDVATDNSLTYTVKSGDHVLTTKEGDTAAMPVRSMGYQYVRPKQKKDMNYELFHEPVKDDFKMAVTFNDTHAKVVYDELERHAAPEAVNLLSNSLGRYWLGPDSPNIIVANQPLDADYELGADGKRRRRKSNFILILSSCLITMVFASAAVGPAALAVRERETSARHIHLTSGCPLPLHWTATLSFFLMTTTAFLLVPYTLALLLLDNHDVLNQIGYLRMAFVIGFLFLLSYSALLLTLSTKFSERAVSVINSIAMALFAFISPMFSWVFMLCGDQCLGENELMGLASWLMPLHAAAMGLYKSGATANLNALCLAHLDKCPSLNLQYDDFDNERCCASGGVFEDYLRLDDQSAGKELIALVLQSCFYIWLLFIVDSGVFSSLDEKWTRYRQNKTSRFHDDLVVAERDYVAKAILKPRRQVEDALLCYDVYKQYTLRGRPFLAVNGLNFSVKKGECFGLLGVNGAGKSTAFKILIAETYPTHGHLLAHGYYVNETYQYMQTFSYCPQFFGLDDFLTGEQNLILVLTLRGLNAADAKAQAESWLAEIGLTEYAKRCVSKYSGGCARRLAAAAALCQPSHIALLDEPTTGVDTTARSRVHAAVLRAKQTKSIIIASHSMDEIEALCDRICIMSAGEVAALGTAAELRERHATGFSAVFKLSASTSVASGARRPLRPRARVRCTPCAKAGSVKVITAVKRPDGPSASPEPTRAKTTKALASGEQPPPEHPQKQTFIDRMHTTFNCRMVDDHRTMCHIHINDLMPYSKLFGLIEALKRDFPDLIEDYVVSETTLEEVFIGIAKEGQRYAESKTRNEK